MLTREEANRIADAIQVLRVDWPRLGVMTVLSDERIRTKRQYRDVLVAFVVLASDPETQKPTRLFEHGPWWEAARPLAPVVQLYRRPTGLDCVTCSLPEEACRARDGAHEFDPRPKPKAPAPTGLLGISNDQEAT